MRDLEIAWRVDIIINEDSPTITAWFKTKKEGERFIDIISSTESHIASTLMPYKPVIVWENSYPILQWENFGEGKVSITIS